MGEQRKEVYFMRVMGIDYGDARTGVAVCDKMEILASPVGVIHEGYEPKVIAKLSEIIKEKKPELLAKSKSIW